MVSEDELRVDVYRDESTVSVRLTHLPTGLTAIGSDTTRGAMSRWMRPRQVIARKLAMKRLEEDLATRAE